MSLVYCLVRTTMRLCRRSLTGLPMLSISPNTHLAVALPMFPLSRDMLRRRRQQWYCVAMVGLRMHVEPCCVVSSCTYPYKQSRLGSCCLLLFSFCSIIPTHTSICHHHRKYIRTLHHLHTSPTFPNCPQTTHTHKHLPKTPIK